ncbi:CheY-like chemotaxis protein [Endozoicomonas sp. NE35]
MLTTGKLPWKTTSKNHERWQLVLMDCEMPVLDGYDATAAIRQFEEEAGLDRKLIIGLSAHAINELKKKALERGMDDYLTKPIDRDLLYKTLVDYLS